MVNLIWFQNDLRIHDHAALYYATKTNLPLVGFYARSFSHPNAKKSAKSVLRKAYIDQTLRALKTSLAVYNIPLIVVDGSAFNSLKTLSESLAIQSIYGHYSASPFERYEAVKIQKEFDLKLYETETLIHPSDLGFDLQQVPQGFTSFRKKVEMNFQIRPLVETSLKLQETLKIDEAFSPDLTPLLIQAGEQAGMDRVHHYLEGTKKIKTYKETRNGMLKFDDSTKFSFYLSIGALSPRYIYHRIKAFEAQFGGNESTYWVIFEMLWRDFFKFQERKHPKAFYAQTGLQHKSIAWLDNPHYYHAITTGQTGFPLVDANIKELLKTGYMSNRGRQNVASFWVKNAGLDWQLGERFFETHLLDYDVASNTGNWQYIAGIGNDFVPFRFFDIVKQGNTYDADTSYLLHYLPALKDVPVFKRYGFGHLPKDERAVYDIDYPAPIFPFYDGLNLMKKRYGE